MNFKLCLLSPLALVLAACSVAPPVVNAPANSVYVGAKEVDESMPFNSTDLQLMAESMARSLAESQAGARVKPTVTLAPVQNKTPEYIDTKAITDSIRTQVLKSGTMRFMTDIVGMGNQTAELERQNSPLYSKSKSVKVGKMEGAKFRIEGNLVSMSSRTADRRSVYYKFSLIMTDNETGEIVWADEKEIRKAKAH